jgi:hypothetical protein
MSGPHLTFGRHLYNDSSIRRARESCEQQILGKTLEWLNTEDGRKTVRAFAVFSCTWPEELSVVFDEQGKVIYWIGPTSVLPANAKNHQTAAS